MVDEELSGDESPSGRVPEQYCWSSRSGNRDGGGTTMASGKITLPRGFSVNREYIGERGAPGEVPPGLAMGWVPRALLRASAVFREIGISGIFWQY